MDIFNTVYGGDWSWKPWANTVAYYPLNSTTTNTDQSWNWNTLTNQWAVFWTYGWVNCANTTGKSLYCSIANMPLGASSRTISVWANAQGGTSGWMAIYGYGQSLNSRLYVLYRTTNNWWVLVLGHYPWDAETTTVMDTNKWYLITTTYDGATSKVYINWTLAWSSTVTLATTSSNFIISWWWVGNETFNWYISNVIVENKAWTSDEIANYYNKTKKNYWL